MTRARKVDPAVLEREYVYDAGNPPISIQGLADKHGLAKSGVAAKALKGGWHKKRLEFRQSLGEKVVEALGDQWVAFETATRQKMMQMTVEYLDMYITALKQGEIKPSTRDMLGVAAMFRTLTHDAAEAAEGEEALLDDDSAPFTEERARSILLQLERGDAGDAAGDLAPTGTEGSGED